MLNVEFFYTEIHGGFLKWLVLRELEKGKGIREKEIFLMEMI